MKKHHSIGIMVWPFIFAVVAVAATYSTIPDMTPQQLEAEIAPSQQETLDQELAAALFSAANRMATAEVATSAGR